MSIKSSPEDPTWLAKDSLHPEVGSHSGSPSDPQFMSSEFWSKAQRAGVLPQATHVSISL